MYVVLATKLLLSRETAMMPYTLLIIINCEMSRKDPISHQCPLSRVAKADAKLRIIKG